MPNEEQNSQFLVQVTYGLEAVTRAIESLQAELREHSQRHNTFANRFVNIDSTLKHMRDDVQTLMRLVRDGSHGQASVIQQLTEANIKVQLVRDEFAKLDTDVGAYQTAKVATRGQVIGAVVSAIVAVLLTIVAIIMQK